jgi:Flp pilus assembly protein TadD
VLAAACGPAWAAQSAPNTTSARELEVLYRRGEPDLARQRLDQALAERPGDAGLRFFKAVLLAEANQCAEALRWLELLVQDFPDLPEPHNNLAVLHAQAGRLDAARQALETALRLDPHYRTAHENLGDVLVRLAQRAYEAAAAGGPAEAALQGKLRLVRGLAQTR